MRSIIALSCAAFLFLAASPAFAQSCGSRGVIVNSSPVYHNPVVVVKKEVVAHEVVTPIAVPVALPVVVPAFTYQYVPPCNAVAPPVAFPGVGTPGIPGYGHGYQMPTAGGYGAPPAAPQYNGPYQQPPQAPQPVLPGQGKDSIKELARLLLEEMRRQDAGPAAPGDDGPPMAVYPGGNTPPVGNTPPANGGAFPPPTVPTPASNTTGGRPNPQSPFAQAAINALARNCASCHTGPGSKGDTVIFSQLNVLDPNAPFRTMLNEINSGRMPPRQSQWRPSPEEIAALQAWLSGR